MLSLNVITYVGLGLSILCMVAALLTLIHMYRMNQAKLPQMMLLNTIAALLPATVLFLAGIDAIDNFAFCHFTAVALHYLLLVCAAWSVFFVLTVVWRFLRLR
jgi:hypothetical protein